MNPPSLPYLQFYNGRTRPIDKERILDFELNAIYKRYYTDRLFDHSALIENLGPIQIDYSNIHDWLQEIPDIDPRSARVFSLWAEDERTSEVVLIAHGFFILMPFGSGKKAVSEYYNLTGEETFYPIAIISSFRTVIDKMAILADLLERVEYEINLLWKDQKQHIISTIEKGFLWKRYVYSFDEIIHFSFLCPSMDREVIEALRQKDYRTTGVMQLLSSSTASYDDAIINDHLKQAKKMMDSKTQDD